MTLHYPSHVNLPLKSEPNDLSNSQRIFKWRPVWYVIGFLLSMTIVALTTSALFYMYNTSNQTVERQSIKISYPKQYDTSVIDAFDEYLIAYNKVYKSFSEYVERYKNFQKSHGQIQSINNDGHQWVAGLNHMSDWNDAEKATLLCYKKPNISEDVEIQTYDPQQDSVLELPAAFDWRQNGCAQKVRDQQKCGSCWAFSVTESLAGNICASTKGRINPVLSVQQLLDCDKFDQGCGGGLITTGIQFVSKFGLCNEADYPYLAHENSICHKCKPLITTQQPILVPRNSIALKIAILSNGPVSVAVDASSWVHYVKGVLPSSECHTDLNHGVLVVGWGHDDVVDKNYWIVQNSWSDAWGENGYIRLEIDEDPSDMVGTCGILLDSCFSHTSLINQLLK